MKLSNFSKWIHWSARHTLNGLKYPGVYALAISSNDLSDTPFSLIKEIVYFGMTNSLNGLRGRLAQFDITIKTDKKGIHGGGERVRYKYRDYEKLMEKLFVSVCPVKCNIESNQPADLMKMGKVAYLEYYCFAKYVRLFGEIPEFNDKKRSPK